MAFGLDIGRILEQYAGANPAQPSDHIEQDFDEVAQNAPQDDLSSGLSEAFRSDQTPPFGNMVGQLFGQSDTQQRTGMLNQLLTGLGPSVIGSILGGSLGSSLGGGGTSGAGGGLGGVLGGLLNRANQQQQVELTPEEVERLSPEQVQELASRAEQENPGIIDHMSRFYAQNPQLIKALGGAALAIALGKMAQRR